MPVFKAVRMPVDELDNGLFSTNWASFSSPVLTRVLCDASVPVVVTAGGVDLPSQVEVGEVVG